MSFNEHHILVNSLRHPDTGKWLLEKESFLQWKKPDSKSLFWLHGPRELASSLLHVELRLTNRLIAGSGKTLLSYVSTTSFSYSRTDSLDPMSLT